MLRVTSPSLLPSSLLSISLFLSSLPFLLSSSLSFIATAAAEEPLSPFFLFLSAPDAATQAAAELLLPCLFLPGLSLADVAAAALEPSAAVEPPSPRIPISHSRHLTRLQLGLLLNHRDQPSICAPLRLMRLRPHYPLRLPRQNRLQIHRLGRLLLRLSNRKRLRILESLAPYGLLLQMVYLFRTYNCAEFPMEVTLRRRPMLANHLCADTYYSNRPQSIRS